ncbi:MAG: XkdX family protein [Eubacteriales bacterium]
MTFEQIKKNYDRKLWNKQMVAKAVLKGVITPEQYTEITGDIYIAQ